MEKNELGHAAVSYGSGMLAVVLGHLLEIATWAQAIAVILGCLVVAVRLAHDVLRLYRAWRGG
jgi:hypothetical protein